MYLMVNEMQSVMERVKHLFCNRSTAGIHNILVLNQLLTCFPCIILFGNTLFQGTLTSCLLACILLEY